MQNVFVILDVGGFLIGALGDNGRRLANWCFLTVSDCEMGQQSQALFQISKTRILTSVHLQYSSKIPLDGRRHLRKKKAYKMRGRF